MKTLAKTPLKNPKNAPYIAKVASFTVFLSVNSIKNTNSNGKIIILNGGNRNVPIIIPTMALHSLF